MRILLINWQDGENNPFGFFNDKLKKLFQSFGCIVSTIELDEKFIFNLLNQPKVDLAITWQGLASNVNIDKGCNLWEEIKTTLVCFHGDHPCHMPLNHSADSAYIHHIYATPSFVRYSNILFKRSHPAIFYMFPNIFSVEKSDYIRAGDFFIFPKNIDSIKGTFDNWKITLKPIANEFLIEASKNLMEDYDGNIYKDHHLAIDELLTSEVFEKIKYENNVSDEVSLSHTLHSMLDKVYRNYASEQVVSLLKDYPLKIIGRGWAEFKSKKNNKHEYLEFSTVANGDFQFYSNYGVIDVAPAVDALHDRQFRALAHKGGFISNSLISHANLFDSEFDTLFYRMNSGSISDAVERIIESPDDHLMKCRNFSKAYNEKYNFFNFYLFLTSLLRQ